jgi:RNase P/RNase MRP subunit POP5
MMRDKKRYLLVESTIPLGTDERSFSHSLYKEIIRCIGETSYHKINPKFMKFVSDNRFIIKSGLSGAGQLVLAFALIKKIDTKETGFYTLKSSGTIKALSAFKD